jgi:hypothetical protein
LARAALVILDSSLVQVPLLRCSQAHAALLSFVHCSRSAMDTLFMSSYSCVSVALVQFHSWARRSDSSALDALRKLKAVGVSWEVYPTLLPSSFFLLAFRSRKLIRSSFTSFPSSLSSLTTCPFDARRSKSCRFFTTQLRTSTSFRIRCLNPVVSTRPRVYTTTDPRSMDSSSGKMMLRKSRILSGSLSYSPFLMLLLLICFQSPRWWRIRC